MLSMAKLHHHAERLYGDLGLLADGDATTVGEPLADVYNALLTEAKKHCPSDAVAATLVPVTKDMHPRVVQALAGQLRLVLGDSR
jgi:hypothetical protein